MLATQLHCFKTFALKGFFRLMPTVCMYSEHEGGAFSRGVLFRGCALFQLLIALGTRSLEGVVFSRKYGIPNNFDHKRVYMITEHKSCVPCKLTQSVQFILFSQSFQYVG